jgi:hypothetical protein
MNKNPKVTDPFQMYNSLESLLELADDIDSTSRVDGETCIKKIPNFRSVTVVAEKVLERWGFHPEFFYLTGPKKNEKFSGDDVLVRLNNARVYLKEKYRNPKVLRKQALIRLI